eukprot:802539-Prorocentrum_lima.AAC.1
MRMRHPPLKFLVACSCISASKPRPKRMRRARPSADAAPIAFNSSYTSTRRSATSSDSSPAS